MGNIPTAKPSPRVENGTLFWYAGDLFQVDVALELTDQDGGAVHIGANDTVTVTFYDVQRQTVHTFTPSVTNDRATLVFDETVSAKFPKGRYTYDMEYRYTDTNGKRKTTLMRDNPCRVE